MPGGQSIAADSPLGSFRVLTDKDARELAEKYLRQALNGQNGEAFTPWDEQHSAIMREDSASQGRLPSPSSATTNNEITMTHP
jgi:hypothetical protein